MLKKLFVIASIILLGIGGGFISSRYFTPHTTPSFGGYNPSGGGTYRLQTSIGTSNTSITLSSFKEPISNTLYTMSYLNSSIEYATIEPQSNNREFVSFTGITQNNDGTATLTGVVRGIASSFPFTASTTLQLAHPGQSIFILSNSPAFYANQFLLANQVSTSTAGIVYSSTTPPHYDFTGAQHSGTYISSTSELASIDYVNAVALVSAPNAATGVKGVVQLATALQTASTSVNGSTGAALVLPSANATDTPQFGCAVGYTGIAGAACSIIADLTGHIKQAWLSLTDNFAWTGIHNFVGTATYIKNLIASTTISVNNGGSSKNWTIPTASTASSTVWSDNGSGVLTSNYQNDITLAVVPNANVSTTNSATTTLASVTIPANLLNTTNRVIRTYASTFANPNTAPCYFGVDFGNGSATTSVGFQPATQNGAGNHITTGVATSTTSMRWDSYGIAHGATGAIAFIAANTQTSGVKYTTTDITSKTYVAFTGQSVSSETCQLIGYTVQILSQ